jgi:hypothetical protein
MATTIRAVKSLTWRCARRSDRLASSTRRGHSVRDDQVSSTAPDGPAGVCWPNPVNGMAGCLPECASIRP